jgi:hypothetical protein
VPGRKRDPIAIRHELIGTTDGIRAHDLIRALLRAESQESIPVLMEYATSGPLDHVRNYASAQLAELVPEGAASYADFFESGLSDAHLAYWSIQGLVRVSGKSSFPVLTQFALNPAHSVEHRGKAIREMALLGGQHFIEGRPSDPGHWKVSDLPINELQEWAAGGFPPGPGFSPPERHPRLDAPESQLERIASQFDAKLAKLRKARQDPVNPSNWLVPASQSDLAAIQARWTLPSMYSEFLRNFSPLRVNVVSRRHYQGLDLYGASELLSAQSGYSLDALTGERIGGWPPEYLLIANHAGDPFVLDLSQPGTVDAPVLTAGHDDPPVLAAGHLESAWNFAREAPTFLTFLERLSR